MLIKFIAAILFALSGVAISVAEEFPLITAIRRDRLAQAAQLIEQHADINAVEVDGMTALHWAVYRDQTATAILLIESGANVNAKNDYGRTPLFLACENGNADISEALLQHKADPNAELPGGETPLMTAARTGKLAVVRQLLSHNAEVNRKERKQQTAIMWAAADGHADVTAALIAASAEFKTPLRSGFTPFFFAIREGHIDVVKEFLKAGIDVNDVMQPKISGGRTPRRGTSPLMLAVENGHFELAEILLQAGADPNDQRSGFTVLHALSWVRKPNRGDGIDGEPAPEIKGNLTSLGFVKKLVAAGADVNAQLKNGTSRRGRLNAKGATPFFFAADTADVPYMQLLVKLGADWNLANVENCPPILAAAGLGTGAPGEEAGTEEESIAAVKFLLDLGADINAVDSNGETAMHGAAYKSIPKMAHFLAENGADPNVWDRKNKHGWTPLRIAQGYRPGNFRPAAAMVEAINAVSED